MLANSAVKTLHGAARNPHVPKAAGRATVTAFGGHEHIIVHLGGPIQVACPVLGRQNTRKTCDSARSGRGVA